MNTRRFWWLLAGLIAAILIVIVGLLASADVAVMFARAAANGDAEGLSRTTGAQVTKAEALRYAEIFSVEDAVVGSRRLRLISRTLPPTVTWNVALRSRQGSGSVVGAVVRLTSGGWRVVGFTRGR